MESARQLLLISPQLNPTDAISLSLLSLLRHPFFYFLDDLSYTPIRLLFSSPIILRSRIINYKPQQSVQNGRVEVGNIRLLLKRQILQTVTVRKLTWGQYRQELVAWLNSLLQLNITKVEQCGTG